MSIESHVVRNGATLRDMVGNVFVVEDGKLINCKVVNGSLTIYKDGTIENCSLGYANFYNSGGIDKFTIIDGSIDDTVCYLYENSISISADLSCCTQYVHQNSLIDNAKLYAVTQHILANGKATNTYIIDGYAMGPSKQYIYSGAIAENTTINGSYSSQYISQGGLASKTTLTHGEQYIEGNNFFTTINYNGKQYIFNKGIDSNSIVNSDGRQYVEGGQTNNTTINFSGTQNIYSNGIANNTTINQGGMQYIFDGTANGTTINSGGTQAINKGGLAAGVTIFEGANQIICDGGTASNITLSKGGIQTITSGGTAKSTTVLFGGLQYVSGGSAIGGVIQSGTSQIVHNGTVKNYVFKAGASQIINNIYTYDTAVPVIDGSNKFEKGAVQIISCTASKINNYGFEQYIVTSASLGDFTIHSGGITTLKAPGSSYSDTCSANKVVINSGGQLIVDANGSVSDITVKKGGVLNVKKDGHVTSATINSGGTEIISGSGAGTYNHTIYGTQNIIGKGAVSLTTIISSGGMQVLSKEGIAAGIAIINGSQVIGSGCSSWNGIISKGGRVTVENRGSAFAYKICEGGTMFVNNGAFASAIEVDIDGVFVAYDGARIFGLDVTKGGKAMVANATVRNAILRYGAIQAIYNKGVGYGTVVSAGASQIVLSTGKATGGTVNSGGQQHICNQGLASGTTIKKGGSQVISSGGTASATKIQGGGVLEICAGGTAKDVAVAAKGILRTSAGAKISIKKTMSVAGSAILEGATVTGGGMALVKGASLVLGKGNSIAGKAVNVGAGSVTITNVSNRVVGVAGTAKSGVAFNLATMVAKGTTPMLAATAKKALPGIVTITTGVAQQAGVYELTKNLSCKKAIVSGVGTLVANGKAVAKNGMTYKLATKGSDVILNIGLDFGKLVKGTTKGGKVSGTAKSDVFYATKGNHTIIGNGGRDVAIYDNAWGNDIVSTGKTGTMTMLMLGLNKNQVDMSTSGADLIITRKNDASQQITVKGYSSERHNVVFGGTATRNITSFLTATKPTTAQTTKGTSEVWKKSGLLA